MSGKVGFFVGWGLLLWLLATLSFRVIGQFLLDPGNSTLVAATFALAVPLIVAATYPVYISRKLTASDRPVAAVCIALPGMLLDF